VNKSYYSVIVCKEVTELEREVNDKIVQGWYPSGHMIMRETKDADGKDVVLYYQTITRLPNGSEG